jgi:hypothetical protein
MAWAGAGSMGAAKSGSGDGAYLHDDKTGSVYSEGPSGMSGPEGVAHRLSRIEMKWADLQSRFNVRNSQQTAPLTRAIEDQLPKARELLAAGNYPAADQACYAIEKHIGDMFSILYNNDGRQYQGGPYGSGGDPQWNFEDMKNGVEIDIQRKESRLAYFSQLLSVGKDPRATETLDKVRALLDKARMELSANRPTGARMALSQVEPLFIELQRLVHGSQTGMAQATEVFRRVQQKATRAKEQARSADDPKAAAANARIQDLLDKAKEALGAGQAEAAKEYSLKAEGMLAEYLRSAKAGEARLSPASWQRLQAKLDRAGEIVAASKNGKASRILEKGKEHFERAQRSHSEGQAARAEVEMDLALKLAAKAVDIARSGPR